MKFSILDGSEGKLFIGGQWVEPSDGKTIDVFDPGNGEKIGTVGSANEQDVKRATDHAAAAFAAWKNETAKVRGEILLEAFLLMKKYKDELARIITLENGKPLEEAYGELAYAWDFVQWYAEEAKRSYGETIPASAKDKRIVVLRQPIGVVGAITPWNFPAAMVTRKLAPALAAGCTVILKPATKTPLAAAALCNIFRMAGVPDGVINFIPAERASVVSKSWMSDERIRKITFTGSTEIGKMLMEQAAGQVKKLSLELGGHAPLIVFDDADFEMAVQGAIHSKFRCGGQSCIASNRLYVQDSIYDKFVARFSEEVAKLRPGHGLQEGSKIGPVIDDSGFAKIFEQIQDATAKGAKLVVGGKPVEGMNGNFLEPTVLTEVSEEMAIMSEETFGPVAPIIRFKDEQEVIASANNTPFGLASYIFSENIDRIIRVSEQLDYGIVGINDGLPSAAQAPFGGIKESGIGREGSRHGMEDYQELKYLSIRMKNPI